MDVIKSLCLIAHVSMIANLAQSNLHPHPGAMSDYDGNEDHIVDNIISSDEEEEEEAEDSKAPPARSANGTAKPKPGTQFNSV